MAEAVLAKTVRTDGVLLPVPMLVAPNAERSKRIAAIVSKAKDDRAGSSQ